MANDGTGPARLAVAAACIAEGLTPEQADLVWLELAGPYASNRIPETTSETMRKMLAAIATAKGHHEQT
jgi:hypothetical protein